MGRFKLGLVVEHAVIVELKAVAALARIHEQHLIAYLAASGLLFNFGAERLEYRRLFPPKTVQASAAYQSKRP
jgi:GxxExxY protein